MVTVEQKDSFYLSLTVFQTGGCLFSLGSRYLLLGIIFRNVRITYDERLG